MPWQWFLDVSWTWFSCVNLKRGSHGPFFFSCSIFSCVLCCSRWTLGQCPHEGVAGLTKASWGTIIVRASAHSDANNTADPFAALKHWLFCGTVPKPYSGPWFLLYSASCLQSAFLGSTNHYPWALKCPFCWKSRGPNVRVSVHFSALWYIPATQRSILNLGTVRTGIRLAVGIGCGQLPHSPLPGFCI